MRAPQAPLPKMLARMLVSFILGILVGGAIFLYMYGQMMDETLLENRQLGFENVGLKEELELREAELSQKNQQRLTISQIEIKVVDDEHEEIDGFIETEVTERLRRDLRFLNEQPLESVADTYSSIIQLVNSKTYDIDQQSVSIEVKSLVIYTTVTLEVSIDKE